MSTIFETNAGSVAVLQGDDGIGLPMALDSLGGYWYPSFRAIITGISISLDGNCQFLHTLSDVIYIYTFGDRISQMQIEGLAFQAGCLPKNGIEAILATYNKNKVANRSGPIQIQIGTTASGRFRGFLTGLQAGIAQPEARISQFNLQFKVIPNRTGPVTNR